MFVSFDSISCTGEGVAREALAWTKALTRLPQQQEQHQRQRQHQHRRPTSLSARRGGYPWASSNSRSLF